MSPLLAETRVALSKLGSRLYKGDFRTFFAMTHGRDLPGGPVIKNPPPSNAEDVGSIQGLGAKIPHATGQLSP